MNKLTTNKFRRITGWAAWLSAAMFFATACVTIDDDTDDCFSLARLQFQYVYNLPLPGVERIAQQVQSIDLYVYNQADDALVTTKRFTKDELVKGNYSVDLRWLRQGDYYMIAYGNKDNKYYECGEHQYMPDARVKMLCSDGNGTVVENPCHFFYGYVEVAKQDNDTKTVGLIKDTNDVIIVVNDLTPTNGNAVSAREMEVNVTLQNGTIKYDNSLAADDTRQMRHITYTTPAVTGNIYSSTTTVGRLFSGDGSKFTLTEKVSGKLLASEDLTDRIITLLAQDVDYSSMDPNVYLDRQDRYVFTYNLELVHGIEVITLISVNHWNKVIQGGNGGILW